MKNRVIILLLIGFIIFLFYKLDKSDNEVLELLREKKVELMQKLNTDLKDTLSSGSNEIIIDSKDFKDTLDISDNFFVYKHTAEIIQTWESEFESILKDFAQVKSGYGNDIFVRVMTFYKGQSLPLETENSNTDIHILIQPIELGYENKTFVISDFYDVDLKSLEKQENSIELTFEHGKFPRKKESIIINYESVKFGNK